MIRKTEHTGFTVGSLAEALAFWQGVLGFALVYTRNLKGPWIENVTGVAGAEINLAVVQAPDGHRIELLEYVSPAPREKFAPRPCDVGSFHLAFEVEDLEAVLARLAPAGWKSQGAVLPVPSGPRAGQRVIYVRGPEGVMVELIQPRTGDESGNGVTGESGH